MRGFEKTGIFPYDPEMVLGKVYTPPTADPCLSESPRKKKFLELTNLVLSEYGPCCGIQSTQVSAMLESIKAHIDGTFFMCRFMTSLINSIILVPIVAFNHMEQQMQEILGSPSKRPRQVKNTQLTTKAGRLLVWSWANK